ncbi:hypothetical protein ABFT23_05030 [Nocardioides sp. C4-1]|uniref:hypothetical protein n=1 Tax=Nocardioides sp. C4-1 TaxID=3151851 RepID=UPI003265D102
MTHTRRVRNLVSASSLVLLTAFFVQTAPLPASAAGGLTSPSIVLYDDCDFHPIRFDLELPEYTDGFSADINIYGPDGLEAGSGFVYGDGSDGAGTEEVFMCDDPRPGRYRLQAEVEACDYDYNCFDYVVDGSSFNLRYPRSRTLIKATSGQRHRIAVTVKEERPRGYFTTDSYNTVVLEKKQGKRWARVSRGYTDARGVARFNGPNKPGRETFRARVIFDSDDDVMNSTSRPLTLS